MTPFQNLINTALLGTDKIGFDESTLPQSIQDIVQQIPETDKETKFLKTAALVSFYEQAGQKPARFTGELLTDDVSKDLPVASEQFAQLLTEILEIQYYYRNDLLALWFDKLIENQQIVPTKSIVTLLGLVESLPKKFRPKIQKVMGQKGLFLLNFKTDMSQWQILPDEQIWAEGRLAERREFFINLRKENPEKAIELLQNTWQQESLNDKSAFLEVINNTFRVQDCVFLESILPEFQYKAKERKTQKECRNLVVSLLCGQAKSTLHTRATEAWQTYFGNQKSKGLLGWVGKENKALVLPQEEDNFLNINVMMAEYGLETSPDAAIFVNNQLYWLSCFLAILPFNFWEISLKKNTDDTLAYFTSDDFMVKISGKKTAILLNALIQNAARFSNIELAKAIIKITGQADHLPLLKILSQTEQENYLINNKQLTNQAAIEACFDGCRCTWSLDFSNKILAECHFMITEKNTYLSDRMGAMLAQYLHPNSVLFLEKPQTYPATASVYHIEHWQKFFAQTIKKTFEIKSKI